MTEQTAERLPLSYVIKSRDFYEARGFSRPYRWAENSGSPFAALSKPLSESRIGVVTTSVMFQDQGDELLADAPKNKAFAQACTPIPTEMFTRHLSWHKTATHTDDVATFLPLEQLRRAAGAGVVGSLSPRFYGVPTNYSQRETKQDALEITAWCEEDEVDVVVLVPL